MKVVKEFKFNGVINKGFEQFFEVDKDGLYLLEISARCKNWRQNWGRLFDDDDLAVSLDGRDLSGVEGRRAFEKPKAGWNGNELKNLSQVNIFILRLKTGEHRLTFKPNQSPKLEFLRIYQISNPSKFEFLPQPPYNQAEDGDRRPWYTFALIDLALADLSLTAKAFTGRQHRLLQSDDDDIQIRINGERQRNNEPKAHPYWFWCGKILGGESRTFEKELNLPSGTHYIELFADRTPTLEKVVFNLTEVLPVGKVKFYKDIVDVDWTHLRGEPSEESEILEKLLDGDEVEIVEERVIGKQIDYRSHIWHKVGYKDKTGFILSSFVELPGQDRETIIQKIKSSARELEVDQDLVLALAGCESRFKPYATSKPYDPGDDKIARGTFQLTDQLIEDLNNKEKPFYSPINDPFNIDQNIAAGINYFKWLYQVRYGNDKEKLRKAVAAYNTGPYDVPVDESLNLELYDAQTRQLVGCVLENKKHQNWKQIFLPLLIFLFGFAAGNGYSYLNWIDFFEPTVPTVPKILSEQSIPIVEETVGDVQKRDCPEVFRGDNDKEIILVDHLCHTVGIFSDQELGLETSDRLDSLRVDRRVIQTENLFYFLATSFLRCGAQNCHYNLYQYDISQNSLSLISTDIFGVDVRLYLSLDEEKIAVVRRTHAMVCDERSYLDLLDLNSKEKQRVDRFQDPELEVTHIDSLEWLSDQKLEILTTHSGGCDPSERTIRHKRFLYDPGTDRIIESEMLEEREVVL